MITLLLKLKTFPEIIHGNSFKEIGVFMCLKLFENIPVKYENSKSVIYNSVCIKKYIIPSDNHVFN